MTRTSSFASLHIMRTSPRATPVHHPAHHARKQSPIPPRAVARPLDWRARPQSRIENGGHSLRRDRRNSNETWPLAKEANKRANIRGL